MKPLNKCETELEKLEEFARLDSKTKWEQNDVKNWKR